MRITSQKSLHLFRFMQNLNSCGLLVDVSCGLPLLLMKQPFERGNFVKTLTLHACLACRLSHALSAIMSDLALGWCAVILK